MARTSRDVFITVRSEGALLPPDFLQQVAEGRDGIPGLSPEAYHLTGRERLNEAVSRSWNRLIGVWAAFQAASTDLKETDPGIGMTREKWLLPLFQELGYGRLLAAKTFEVSGKPYPISHLWQYAPIHLVGRNVDLDRRSPGVVGAAKTSPHGLLQEFLNRSERHLWGFLSNGLQLRILRNNKSLTRQAYVEFDLVGMMEGQVYADFALLWLLCHQSRVEAERPEQCWLERWSDVARQQGTRALDQLRDGVERAIAALGRGFLAHGANSGLVERLRSGALSKQDYYRQLLRTVYRLIFLFVGEDRDLLLVARPGVRERERYMRYYSITRFRTLAERRRGSPHADLWRGQSLVLRKLSSDTGSPELGLPPLGSFLWSAQATPDLDVCELANADLLDAIRALAFTVDGGIRRVVDFRNLGPEELGSVYESLLELHPEVNADAATFSLTTAAGHERKTTGSYYTPTSLIECLLDSALDPVLDEAAKQTDPEKAILNLKVCDPACGSGHFLIAAGHRIATRLATVRTGDEEPSPEAVRTALRDVVGRCLYGVDMNPMAVELCKVNLWLEALQPGKPLSFLDHHIRVGNSLLGATPELIATGLPDDAFTAIEGDDKKVCAVLKKRNKQERKGQQDVFHLMVTESKAEYNSIAARQRDIDEVPDDTLNEIQRKAEQFRKLVVSPEYQHAQQVADAWCAAFVWHKQVGASLEPVTTDTIRRLEGDSRSLTPPQQTEVERLSRQYQFFHWHLAFPEVFGKGGFDCVLGNPPWERVKLQEKEWFAERSPEIVNAPNAAARKRLIEALKTGDPVLYKEFLDDSRKAEGESHLLRNSGRYPLCGRGDINLYAVFAEGMRNLLNPLGAVGAILPSGLATDDTTKLFFSDLMGQHSLWSFYEFENEGFFAGAGQGHMVRFALTTIGGLSRQSRFTDFVFQAKDISDLGIPDQHFTLSAADIALFNPNTRTCPIFRSRRDAELTKAIYRHVPVLIREAQGDRPEDNPWGITFSRMFDMANDSDLFRTRAQLEADGWQLEGNVFRKDGEHFLPLYEAKLIQQFNHRHSDFTDAEMGKRAHILPATPSDRLEHSDYFPLPFYWVGSVDVTVVLGASWTRQWLFGWRRVTDSRASARTLVSSLMPRAGAGDSVFLILPGDAGAGECTCLLACLNSFALDYVTRQKLGGLNLLYYIIRQLAVLPPATYFEACSWVPKPLALGAQPFTALRDWLLPRVLELTYTAWDLEPFAQDCGWSGPPFRWDEERRFLLRCELDAAFFHLYLLADGNGVWRLTEGETPEDLARLQASFSTPRDAVAYIMDTFPIVRRRDEEKWGDYRTKRIILEIYDAIQEAIRTGQPYKTRLDPPPADPRCCHPPRE